MYKNFIDNINDFFYKYNKIVFISVFLLFCCITAVGIFVHEPWRDEAQAWLVSQDLNFFEILKFMRYEGHLFLWYVLLMPFTKLHLSYPMPMLVLNMFFMWGTVYILWKKIPLNPMLKILITFSMPVCYQYAVIARCYSVGIFLLILLTALFPQKLKHPYLYTILIMLCANTSLYALIGATLFGIFFLIEYINSNRKFYKNYEFYILFLIAIITISLVLYQCIPAVNMIPLLDKLLGRDCSFSFLFSRLLFGLSGINIESFYITFFVFLIYFIFSCLFFFEKKQVFLFYLFSFFGLYYIRLFLYNGSFWHDYFFYVYLMITLCFYSICKNDNNISKCTFSKKLFYIFFVLISLLLIVKSVRAYYTDINKDFSNNFKVAEYIYNNKEIKNSNFIICDVYSAGMSAYFRNYGINSYNCYNGEKTSYFDYSVNNIFKFSVKKLSKNNLLKLSDKPMYLIAYIEDIPLQSDTFDFDIYKCIKSGDSEYEYEDLCIIKLKYKESNKNEH